MSLHRRLALANLAIVLGALVVLAGAVAEAASVQRGAFTLGAAMVVAGAYLLLTSIRRALG